MIKKLKSLKDHQGFMRYFMNTSWLFSEKILRMFVSFFVGIWVARYLGPEQFGLYSYAQSFVGLFTVIATLGLDSIVVRELVKDGRRVNELIGTSFWLKLIGAISVLIILSIVINFTSNDSYTNTLIFIIASATIFQSFNVIDFYFQSKVMSKYVVYANVMTLFISSIVKIVLILNKAPLEAFAWVVFFDSFVLACGFLYFFLKKPVIKISHLKFDKITAINLIKDSWPLILSSFVASIYLKLDQVMIKEMINDAAVGQYAVAVKLSELWYIIPVIITSSLFPAIVNTKNKDKYIYNNRVQNLYNLMIWTSIFIAIIITFIGDRIVELLYGKDFIPAGQVLIVHIWAGVIIFYGHVRHKWAICENLQQQETYMQIFGAISNIILNILLIPKLGIIGAAYATVVSYFIGYIFSSIFFNKFHISLKMLLKTLIFPFAIFYQKVSFQKRNR